MVFVVTKCVLHMNFIPLSFVHSMSPLPNSLFSLVFVPWSHARSSLHSPTHRSGIHLALFCFCFDFVGVFLAQFLGPVLQISPHIISSAINNEQFSLFPIFCCILKVHTPPLHSEITECIIKFFFFFCEFTDFWYIQLKFFSVLKHSFVFILCCTVRHHDRILRNNRMWSCLDLCSHKIKVWNRKKPDFQRLSLEWGVNFFFAWVVLALIPLLFILALFCCLLHLEATHQHKNPILSYNSI